MFSLRCTLPAIALATVLITPPLAADEQPTALQRDLPTLTVAGPTQYRLVRVHGLYLPAAAPRPQSVSIAPDAKAAPITAGRDGLTVTATDASACTLLVPGRIALGPEEDRAVNRHVLLTGGVAQDLPTTRASDDADRREPMLAAAMLPPAMRWHALVEPRDTEVQEMAQTWTRIADSDRERDSVLDLAAAERTKHRAAEYRLRLAQLPAVPEGLRAAGWAVYVDGALANMELTADPDAVPRLWSHALAGIALEASYLELDSEILDEDTAAVGSTDKQRRHLRGVLRELAEERSEREPFGKAGFRTELRTAHGILVAVQLGDALGHATLASDPAARTVPRAGEIATGPTLRTGPSTQEEERVIERRED